VWILAATVLLMVINYFMVYNRLYSILDLGLLIYMGVFCIPEALTRSSYAGNVKPLLDCFFLMLIFASIRVLNRHEFRQFLLQRALPGKKALVSLSLVSAITLWCCVFTLPRPLQAYGLTATKSNLKNIGTALEMYSTDNMGLYPRELSEVTPDYLKTLPRLDYMGDSTNTEYYRDRYGYTGGYGYEVSGDAAHYTVTVAVPDHPSNGKLMKIRYTSREGLMEDP